MVNNLAFWSFITIIIRILSLIVLIHVSVIQHSQFRYKSSLQPLKRLLFYIPISVGITNIPQIFLSYGRMYGHTGSATLTSLATVFNAIGVLLIAILLLMVYRYKGNDN